MQTHCQLVEGGYYHIYNRGNNSENLFVKPNEYSYFMLLTSRYLYPVMDVYAYCLMPNHFHFLVRIVDQAVWRARLLTPPNGDPYQEFDPSRRVGDLCNAYAKVVNVVHSRTGSLFEKPFRRKRVNDAQYLAAAVRYIHRNPQNHGFVDDFRDWAWTSYGLLNSGEPTALLRDDVRTWFRQYGGFEQAHAARNELDDVMSSR